ncbi:MAG: PstS family phosphate ABC transporter substrate-binding protein [Planctomycetota bacterium]|nr:PstS family phosphate ABC transporter substrate-binding protein [Planctomycetota bacterium]MDA1113161.1 PstS family phosphate ABC transporter substrate-binding protein [Planctomycetota bacterium]
MNNHFKTFFAAVLAVALATALAPSATAQASALRGNIVVDGSSTVYPITEAAAAAFRKEYPNVNITVAVSGTGGGFKRFAVGEIDISDASRPIKDKEFLQAKENGVSFVELPVALDGLSIVLSPNNTWVDQLTVDDLKSIYLEDGTARKWSDLNPEWPNETIKVYSPGTDSGTFDYFKEVIVGKTGSFRPDMSVSEDDNVLVTGVSGDKYAIGYFGASYYFENKDKLRAAAIVNPQTGKAVMPTPANVVSGAYAPLSRPLFIYANVESLRRPAMRKFMEFYLENAGKFAKQVQYVPTSDKIAAQAKAILNKRRTGTVFVIAEMHADGIIYKKRTEPLVDAYTEENLLDTK